MARFTIGDEVVVKIGVNTLRDGSVERIIKSRREPYVVRLKDGSSVNAEEINLINRRLVRGFQN